MMPRGDPTRIISARIPERLAQSIEERAAREGLTIGDLAQAVLLGTFRYPGKAYSWTESQEREKILRQVAELRAANARLVGIIMQHDPTFSGLTEGRIDVPERAQGVHWFSEVEQTHQRLNTQVRRRRAARDLTSEGIEP